MTEARVVVALLSDDILTGQWAEHNDYELDHIKNNMGVIIADEYGNFSIKTDDHTTVFVACQRINFIRLETR